MNLAHIYTENLAGDCKKVWGSVSSFPPVGLFFVFPGWSFQMGSAYQFHSWRVFVLVCAFPSVAAIAALSAMPESPRFYLEVSRCALWQCTHTCIWMWCFFWTLMGTSHTEQLCTTWPLLFTPKQNGKHDEGWMILKQVHDTNMRAKGYPEKVFSVSICEKNSQRSHGSPRQRIK